MHIYIYIYIYIFFFFFFTNRICSVAQLCLTLGGPLDCNPPGFSAHGISQARILNRVAFSSSRDSSQPEDWTWVFFVSCIGRGLWKSVSLVKRPGCWERTGTRDHPISNGGNMVKGVVSWKNVEWDGWLFENPPCLHAMHFPHHTLKKYVSTSKNDLPYKITVSFWQWWKQGNPAGIFPTVLLHSGADVSVLSLFLAKVTVFIAGNLKTSFDSL